MNSSFLKFFALLLILSQYEINSRLTYQKIAWGNAPSQFCTNHDLDKPPSGAYNLIIDCAQFWLQGQTQSIQLTRKPTQSYQPMAQSGFVYYNYGQNVQNGFILSFNMLISDPTCQTYQTSECYFNIFGVCLYRYNYQTHIVSCGGDGFAVVVSQGGNNLGNTGGGLGYQGLSNVFAIEFDTNRDTNLNDPGNTNAAHISVIARSGQAQANEIDSIAYNDFPINFGNPNREGYVKNAFYTIQYLNSMLRVYINNVLQLAVYTPFNIGQLLGVSKSALFQIGVTASTSDVIGNAHLLTNMTLQIVRPTISQTQASFVTSPAIVNYALQINFQLYDNCGNVFWPMSNYDSLNHIGFIHDADSGDCQKQKLITQLNSFYQIQFKCTKSGSKKIYLTYQGKLLPNPVSFTVEADNPQSLSLFNIDQVGYVNAPYTFGVKALDYFGNTATTTPQMVQSLFTIQWPTLSQSKKNYVVSASGKDWSVTFTPDQQGVYTVISNLLANSGKFSVTVGYPDINVSNSQLVMPNTLTPLNGAVPAGSTIWLMMNLLDKYGNAVDGSQYVKNYNFELYKKNAWFNTNDPDTTRATFYKGNQIYFVLSSTYFTSVGTIYEVQPYDNTYILGGMLRGFVTCSQCQITVSEGLTYFPYTHIYQWNWQSIPSNSFSPSTLNFNTVNPSGCSGVLSVVQGAKFQFYIQLFDQFNNLKSNVDFTQLVATLSGNNMDTINLQITPQYGAVGVSGYGALLTVAPADQPVYNWLVGRCNYVIQVYLKSDQTQKKQWFLSILSDGSDSDAGNGQIAPAFTKLRWGAETNFTQQAIAGQQQTIYITLVNTRGERHNNWINTSLINLSFYFSVPSDICAPITQYITRGVYSTVCNFTSVTNIQRVSLTKVNNSQVLYQISSMIVPGQISQIQIQQQNLVGAQQLANQVTDIPFSFNVKIYDAYLNLIPQVVNLGQFVLQTQQNGNTLTVNAQSVISSGPSTQTITFKSPYANNNIQIINAYFNQNYTVNIYPGNPDYSKSSASIDQNATTYNALSQFTFTINPVDSRGNSFSQQNLTQYLNGFGVTVKYTYDGQTQQVVRALVTKAVSSTQSQIVLNSVFYASLSTTYVFIPTYQGGVIPCSSCSVFINPGAIYPQNTQILIPNVQQSNGLQVLSQAVPLQIQNSQSSPIFYMQFFDQYNNSALFDSTYTGFKAQLFVPYQNQQPNVYNFNSSQDGQKVRFVFSSNITQFSNELANSNAYIVFTANQGQNNNVINQKYYINLAGNGQTTHTNNVPTVIVPNPNQASINAGQLKTITLTLLADNGLMYKDPQNGWYSTNGANLNQFIQVSGLPSNNFTLTNGNTHGTYLLTYIETVAGAYTLSFKFKQGSNGPTINGNYTFQTIINSLGVYSLQIQSSDYQTPFISGQTRTLTFVAYDQFKNKASSYIQGQAGLSLSSQQNQMISFSTSSSQLFFTFTPTQTTNLILSANQPFLNGTQQLNSIILNVQTGLISTQNSYTQLNQTQIIAGSQIVLFQFFPRDSSNNLIQITGNYINNASLIKGFIQYADLTNQSFSGFQVSSDQTYFYYSLNVTKSGIHQLQAQFNSTGIQGHSDVLNVKAAQANWNLSSLSHYDRDTGQFQTYNSSLPFIHNQIYFPILNLLLFDNFGNPANFTSSYVIDFYISGQNFTYQNRYPFIKNQYNNQYQLISDDVFNYLNSTHPTSFNYTQIITPQQRWINNDLVNNLTYTINVKEQTQGLLTFSMYIIGPAQDPQISNLPLEPNNTVLYPATPLQCQAGQTVSFLIETRTTNPNLIPNYWIPNYYKNVQLQFSYGQINTTYTYNIQQGTKLGQYQININCFKAHSQLIPIQITLVLFQKVTSVQTSLIITPGPISQMQQSDILGNVQNANIQDQNTDQQQVLYFIAFDQYQNPIQLTQNNRINANINVGSNRQTYNQVLTSQGLYRLSYQPQVTGPLTINFGNISTFSGKVNPGQLSVKQSIAYCQDVSNITAGNNVSLYLLPKDQWGNQITFSSVNDLQNYTIAYDYQLSNQTTQNLFYQGTNTFSVQNGLIVFTQKLTIKGQYQFFVYVNGQKLNMQNSTRYVVPAALSFQNSHVYHFDYVNNQFDLLNSSQAINEQNYNQIPQLYIISVDIYGNEFDNFPTNPSNYSIILQSGQSGVFNGTNQLSYKIGSVQQNQLSFSIDISNSNNYNGYKNALQSQNNILNISYNGQSITYLINLNGQSGDSDSTYLGNPDAAFSIVTPNRQFTAGQTTLIYVELRTSSNKRAAATVNTSLSVQFYDKQGNLNSNFINYECYQLQLKGTFYCQIGGTQATYSSYINAEILYNNLALNTKCALSVNPSNLNYVQLISGAKIVGSQQVLAPVTTDQNNTITLLPFDTYGNILPGLEPSQISIQFQAQNQQAVTLQINSFRDQSNAINFQVKSQYVGQIYISSSLFQQNLLYTWNVISGKISSSNSILSLSTNSLVVGNYINLSLIPYDKYNNLNNVSDPNVQQQVSIKYYNSQTNQLIITNNTFGVQGNSLIQQYTQTQVGNVFITIEVNGLPISCQNCNVSFLVGQLDISQTQVIVLQSNQYVPSSRVEMTYGNNQVMILAQLYDTYKNRINPIQSNLSFTADLQGYNMDPMYLSVSQILNNTQLQINVNNATDQQILSRLVIQNNYLLTLHHNKYSFTIPFDVLGNSTFTQNAGNGLYSLGQTYISNNNLILTAGVSQTITIELRNSLGQRLNSPFDYLNRVKFQEIKNMNINNLTLNSSIGDQFGRINLNISGIQSIPEQTGFKQIAIVIDGLIVGNTISVDIQPNNPDFSKTQMIADKSYDINPLTNPSGFVSFKLFDTYGNPYTRYAFSSNFKPVVLQGNVSSLNNISLYPNGAYGFTFTPIYPPNLISLNVQFNFIPTNGTAISTLITTQSQNYTIQQILNWPSTQFIGADLSGKPVDQNINFYIMLKDQAGFCFQSNQSISLQISGPYNNSIVDDLQPADTLTQINVNSSSNGPVQVDQFQVQTNSSYQLIQGYSCNQIYIATIKQNTLQRIGYYQFQFSINQSNTQNIKIRQTYMTAGQINLNQTLISFPSLYNRGNKDLHIAVNTTDNLFIICRDSFKNIINKNVNLSIQFNINNYQLYTDFNYSIINLNNGTYGLQITIYKTGLVQGAQLIFNNFNDTNVSYTFDMNSFQKLDVPNNIYITPGQCSSKNSIFDFSLLQYQNFNGNFTFQTVNGSQQLQQRNLQSGKLYSMLLTCKDSYGNTLQSGGDKFQVVLNGNQLNVVQSDSISANVTDLNNGSYNASFIFTWEGKYLPSVSVNNNPILINKSVSLTVALLCNATNPWLCIQGQLQGQCVSGSYINCGYSELQTCNISNPIQCLVNGVNNCVSNQQQCDCPVNQTKCPFNNVCVPNSLASTLCPTLVTTIQCSSQFPYQCSNGQCRSSLADCPSQPVCPPRFTLCPDQTCVDSSLGCNYNVFQGCPTSTPFKCFDQSCAASFVQCPTMLTCNGNQVVCQDNSCASSVLQCRIPATCSSGVLCSDQSCRPDYSSCPKYTTCPLNYALCSDNTCKISCQSSESSKSNSRFIRILNGVRSLQATNNNSSNQISLSGNVCQDPNFSHICPGGQCAQSEYQCPSQVSCPLNSIQCPDLSCRLSFDQCVTNICQNGYIHCADGRCVSSKDLCSTQPICPSLYPILCPQNLCVQNVTQCPDIISCPLNMPYRCGTGECRANSNDCPTLITCPQNRPFKCTDGSCQKSKESCLNAVQAQLCPSNFPFNCFDGSCSKSSLLCPTQQTCPTNYVRCWNNECQIDLQSCKKIISDQTVCPSNTPYLCSQGSCASNPFNCPTQIICPMERPIKCDDGTCKMSNDQCYPNTQCSVGKQRCPDGSCTSTGACGTPVTCSVDAPYICFDNTCRQNPLDCVSIPTCTSIAPILCPDGSCSSSRDNCNILFSQCPIQTPVRCPDFSCQVSRDNCTLINGCPSGLVMCNDGSCLPSAQLCQQQQCPSNLKYQCQDGFCVSDLKFCDQSNGCPYNSPFKCTNGQCVQDKNQCNQTQLKNVSTLCINPYTKQVACPDGSCATSLSNCYTINGCPQETPQRCASGLCINPNTTQCLIAQCPQSAPIKCGDGTCVLTSSDCRILQTTINQCLQNINSFITGNIVQCADGRCVASSDQCRPLYPCLNNQVRCGDGTCRSSNEQCPLVGNTCPSSLPYRCAVGACVVDSTQCPLPNGCTTQYPQRCIKTGQCAQTEQQCQQFYNQTLLPNNCTIDLPYFCIQTQQCMISDEKCVDNIKCPNNQYFCPTNKQCVADIQTCLKSQFGCLQSQIQCPDNTCTDSYQKCNMTNGCPVLQPYQGQDGKCHSSPFQGAGENGKAPTISCPDYQPFMCSTGQCVGDQNLCMTQLPCLDITQFRCPNQQCVSNKTQCKSLTVCPITLPVLCESGQCVQSPVQCNIAKYLFCTTDKPFQCVTGKCVSSYKDCVPSQISNGNGTYSQQLSNNLTVYFDVGCSAAQPNRCSDGSCRNNSINCPVNTGCPNLLTPYRCKSGACVINAASCQQYDANLQVCANNFTRCSDGYCRRNCPDFHGCPLNKPLMCATGYCAKSLAECAGESSCNQLSKPFKCADGTCVSNISLCSRPLRTYKSEILQISVDGQQTNTYQFIKSDISNNYYGQITTVAGSLLQPLSNSTNLVKQRLLQNSSTSNSTNSSDNQTNQIQALYLRSYPDSLLVDNVINYDSSQLQYVNKFFPLSYGSLSFDQGVRSPVVYIFTNGSRNNSQYYRFPILLQLQADMLQGSNKTNDYCLGKQNSTTKQFTCVSRQLTSSVNYITNNFEYPVSNDGIYAILFNPQVQQNQSNGDTCDYFCQNKTAILLGIFGGLLGVILLSYSFWRMSRYIVKYRLMKSKQYNMAQQINELNQQSTNVTGQSLGDRAQGIQFSKNEAYQQNDSNLSDQLSQYQQQLERNQKKEKLLEQTNKELNERNKTLLEQLDLFRRDQYKKGTTISDDQFELGNMQKKEF